jgi:hypothetical protein
MTPSTPAQQLASNAGRSGAAAATRLDLLRRSWLAPAELVRTEPEVIDGYPKRIVTVDADAARQLSERTLTNLYNERPTWLANAHRELDAAVAAAYGWPADISTDDALEKLLALNAARASKQ